MVGTFADPSGINDLTRLSSCTPPTAGVTHNNPLRIDQPGPLTFTWTAPAAGTGPIWFRYTIVQNVSTWWADDSSAIVQEGEPYSCVDRHNNSSLLHNLFDLKSYTCVIFCPLCSWQPYPAKWSTSAAR